MATRRVSPNRWSHLLVAMLLLQAGAWAQGDRPDTKVLLAKDRLQQQFDTVKCVKNVLKANPLLFFRGEIPIYYERAISPRLSLELGLGITLRNYLNLSLTGDEADDFGAGTDIIARPSYHLGVRYYLQDDIEPQGLYLQTAFAHLSYAKDISVKGADGQFTGATERDERIYNDLRLLMGYQMLGGSNNWLFDIYGGLGLRDRSMVIVEQRQDLDPNATNPFVYTTKDQNDLVPALYVGVKFGLGF